MKEYNFKFYLDYNNVQNDFFAVDCTAQHVFQNLRIFQPRNPEQLEREFHEPLF